MKNSLIKVLKVSFLSILLTMFLTSCSSIVNTVNPSNHKKISGSNDFHSLVNNLVEKQKNRLKLHLTSDDIVLVSDFVNLDKLKNRSKLGFLLSEHLKDSLANRNIVVREVELSSQFQYGKQGLNVLTRKYQDIQKKYVDGKFAVVGTYTITTQSLIVFVKLIDLSNGSILSSSSGSTLVDEEILELERVPRKAATVVAPLVL